MSGECILVIDDSKEIIKHLTEYVLPTFGYKTLQAYDGRTGLKLIRDEKPDLVMLDYNLPEMTGIDILQQMAQDSINTPVVLMTGYGSELSAIEAFRLGAKDYLIKPFTVDEIVETIDRALVETRLLHDKKELAEQLRRMKVELSRQNQEMTTLFNIGKAIASLLSVDKVLERVLEAAKYLTEAEESTIWLQNESGTHLQTYDRTALHDGHMIEASNSDSQLKQVMRTGRPIRQSVFSGQGIKVKTDYFARAVLYVPLKLRGMTMGVLGVSNLTAYRSFSKRDEFLLAFLADYAAIALENARVFQAADQALASRLDELHTLIDITRTITASLDLDEVVRLTVQQVHASWHIEACSLWLLDQQRETLSVLTNVGTPADILTQMEVPVGEGFVGHVAQTGKWIYTNDALTHPLHYRNVDIQTGFNTRSLLCVPLTFRGKVIGAMQFLNKLDGDFDDQDVERALSIAAAVAIATTNALLFEGAGRGYQTAETATDAENGTSSSTIKNPLPAAA
jgi:GAF domain-containing protein/CheY-like chemotaxis protein